MRSKLHGLVAMVAIASFLAGCGQFSLDLVTPTSPPPTVAPTATEPPASATPSAPTETAAPSATPNTTPAADNPPVEGLTYSAPDGIYSVDATGQLVKIFDRPEAMISPDATQALYVDGDDIWLATLGTGAAVNLTNTPDRIEHSPRWWPARPDLVVFGSYAVGRELVFGPALFPTMVKVDGTEYRMLDQDTDAFSIALSPDGHTLAYGLGPTAFLYDINTDQRTVFDPLDYGLNLQGNQPSPTVWSVGGPAFSSDGVHLSWGLGQFFDDGTNQMALIIVDLAAHSTTMMHTYHLPPSDAIPAAGVWSPDGQWVAYYAFSDSPADQGMWAARVSGGEERYLGAGAGAAWSADGSWLAFNGSQGTTILYRTEDWSAASFGGPVQGSVIGW